jgi:hypothetical protein
LKTSVSGPAICPIFRVKYPSSGKFLTLKMAKIAGPGTLVFNLNQTPGN